MTGSELPNIRRSNSIAAFGSMYTSMAKKMAEQGSKINLVTKKQRYQTFLSGRFLSLFYMVIWGANLQTVSAVILQPIARINVGGNAFVDSQGNAWEADAFHAYYKGGGTPGNVANTTRAIANTTDQVLYQTERWWLRTKPGPCLYQIPVGNGVYTVELHFAEMDPSRSTVGNRVFDIWMEGALFYSGFDIVKKAGAAFAAVKISTTVEVVDSALTIELKAVQFNPKISAIAVFQNIVARINAGGDNFVDSQGNIWEADALHAYYKGGGTPGNVSMTTKMIGNTTDPILYQSEHLWRRTKPGPYLYQIPVSQGIYTVEMHFAEINSLRSMVGKRVFDIWVEGALFYPSFDIVKVAGAAFVAVKMSKSVAVVDGALTIELKAVLFNPKISAIAVYQTALAKPSQHPSTAPSDHTSNVRLEHKTANTSNGSLLTVARINAGGKAFVDSQGNAWEADAFHAYYKGGGTPGNVANTTRAIANTTDQVLYQSERWWLHTKPGPYLYQIPVANGVYTVELHFAEMDPSRSTAGKRVFDIWVEGALFSSNFDIVKKAGAAFTAFKISTTVAVVDSALKIELKTVKYNPQISAIAVYQEIVVTGPSASPSPTRFQPVLINSGGGPYVDVTGQEWKGDIDSNYFAGGQTASFAENIRGTLDVVLYQSERFGSFTYEIPLLPGDYEVILHFAELVNMNQGGRIFNVTVEQSPSFTDVDIVALVGVATALTLKTVATILDGSLSLSFLAVAGNPKLSAIEINLVGYHLAHAVASGPYTAVDILGRGFALVTVDGTSSHTHAPGLYLTNWTWFEGSSVIGMGEIVTLNLSVGQHVVTLRVKDNGDNESSDTTTVTVLPVGYPVITALSPSSGDVTGGTQVTISGYGFNFTADTTVVHFGSYNLTGVSQITISNVNTIVVQSIPAATIGIPVLVTVSTPIGESNAGTYTYVNMVPIDWTRGNLYNIYAPTTLAFGPDEKLYIGTSDGKIAKLTLSENYAVIESVVSAIVGQRAILGLTFDPMDRSANPSVYVSHSKTFHGEYRSSSGQAINGKVSLVSGANLDVIHDIITGLPVSDHDHAVNGLEFGDAGELYIMIGGNTNGGIPGALSGSERLNDNVLSSAALVAHLSDPHFNGSLTYDAPDDGNLNPGFGVEVFAAGLRNPYDVVLHSNKKLYATDNGPNLNYGAMSTSCTRSVPDIGEKDKLNLLVRGGYYGQPNRKRGESDPRQCVWHSVLEASSSNYTAPLATLQSSSDGIIEFQSDHFGKQMRGNLIVSMYTGGLYRIILTPNGTVAGTPFILQSDGGLDIQQGPDGTLFVAKYKEGQIRYFIPLEPASTSIVAKSVFPRRGGQAGGDVISIFGENLSIGGSPTVSVGGSACPLLTYSAKKITCTLPGGTGTADITVTTGNKTSTFLAGYRYITGLPASIMFPR